MFSRPYLVLNYSVQALFTGYQNLFTIARSHAEPLIRRVHLLERSLEVPAAGYWKGRYTFSAAKNAERDHRLLGRTRIREILISAVFPVMLLAALRQPDTLRETHILELYDRFPAPEWNRSVRSVFQRLLAQRNLPANKVKTASIYQGMLHLAKHYCHLPACTSCVFKNS
ncbi:hypothetical protein CSB45_10210 [candidate division KSB3 bacterium]|uniref:DUF2851 domain-containing protein n=1 Tax=candidate division KSB3 bacterium TaxID=2044937 RepID=A0A2G6E436_9BACT|nr:MAG: hypothetical protein CSB45_10210 [candidate division KSB3 bacterium]PIE29311.1 MAG: hypothetical protein CSA57_08880 [candidate division KSB3 bacterium]